MGFTLKINVYKNKIHPSTTLTCLCDYVFLGGRGRVEWQVDTEKPDYWELPGMFVTGMVGEGLPRKDAEKDSEPLTRSLGTNCQSLATPLLWNNTREKRGGIVLSLQLTVCSHILQDEFLEGSELPWGQLLQVPVTPFLSTVHPYPVLR